MSWFWTHRGRAWAFVAHAASVTFLTALFYVLVFTTAPEDGFNFGAGFIGLALLGLGLPWSLPALALDPDRLDGMPEIVRAGIDFGPAFLNVLLHGLVLFAASRRQTPPGART
jgi:hypothetical protein